jgi:hypothetical protein
MSAIGPKRTFLFAPHMSAFGGKADIDELDLTPPPGGHEKNIGDQYCGAPPCSNFGFVTVFFVARR